MRELSIIALLLCSHTASPGQAVTGDSLSGAATILSEPPGAEVFIDSAFVGITPLRGFRLKGGEHLVKVFYPSVTVWNALSKTESIRVPAGAQVEKIVELGSLLTISSTPADGIVLYQGLEIGRTPLYAKFLSRISGDLLIQKEGYDTHHVELQDRRFHPILVELQPKLPRSSLTTPDVLPSDYENGASKHWLTYTSASTMIASGVLSAYLKDRANGDFDQYLRTNDPALLSSTRRLDRQAAISLVVTQLSFALLTYLLLSE